MLVEVLWVSAIDPVESVLDVSKVCLATGQFCYISITFEFEFDLIDHCIVVLGLVR